MPTDAHNSRWRAWSTSRTIGLLRTSFLMAYSNGSGISRQPFGGAQLRATSTRVLRHLVVGRHERFSGQDADERLATLEGTQRVLHDAILERMKCDDDKPSARAQPGGGRLDESIEPFELAVHPDAKRLKRACRRIDPHESAARNRAAHDGREAKGRVDGRVLARLDDGACDATGETLLTVGEDGIGELAFGGPCDQIRSRLAAAAVHAHVERLVALKAEAAARRLELHRRDPQIRQRAVDVRNLLSIEHVVERA